MTEQSLNVREIIGLLADIMTLFGVSGVFAWSFVRKNIESSNPADSGVKIFAYSVKTFIVFVLLIIFTVPAFFSHFLIILVTSGTYFPSNDGLWNSNKPFSYVLAYIGTALWLIPLIVLTASSVYVWSLEPFKRFLNTFRE